MKLHSLFFKLFLSFWIASTLVGLSLLLMENNNSQQLARRWHRVTADAFSVYADSAADAHEDTETIEAQEYLADLERRTGIRAWLFDARNNALAGYRKNAYASRTPEKKQRILALAERARQTKQTVFDPQGSVTLAAHATLRNHNQDYVLVGELPTARFGPWEAEPKVHLLRLLAVLLTTGIVSWALGRHLTQPIVALREATRRMAEGNLSTRPGASLGRRRDELADLSRDFDGMAERIEKLLEEQNRLVQAQRRLLGDVSHELRSPLARMGVALELARDCAPKESPVLCSTDGDSTNSRAVSTLDDALNYIENEAGHLSEIIDQLLTLTRLEIGVQQLENHPVDLTALVYAVAADADFEARSRGRFVRVLDSDDCATQGALPLLRSAIENVLRNAVCYTAEGTTVEVTLKTATSSEQEPSTRNMAQITVRDYGPGVPAAELENIFRPFFRVVGARDRKSGGDGLGLAITQRAVHLHGGNVTAFNSPDGGLVVKIHLPMQKKVEFQR